MVKKMVSSLLVTLMVTSISILVQASQPGEQKSYAGESDLEVFSVQNNSLELLTSGQSESESILSESEAETPPSWVEEKVRERQEWSESGAEGPPPWAAQHAREHYEWSESGAEGPPPWVEEKVCERREWSESGAEGPPPWVEEKARERQEWSESGAKGPPPWAAARGKKDQG